MWVRGASACVDVVDVFANPLGVRFSVVCGGSCGVLLVLFTFSSWERSALSGQDGYVPCLVF